MVPRRTTAFRFLEPITAPIPGRPPARPSWETTVETLHMFSPEGPMRRTPAALPCLSLSFASASKESSPHRSEASLMEYSSFSTWR